MSYKNDISRAIKLVMDSPKSDDLNGRFTSSLEEFIDQCKDTKLGQHAARIAKTASVAGMSDQLAMAMAVIAAPESAFNPFARHAKTGASGYFQLIPRYFRTSGPSNTNARLLAQIKEIASDPSGMYGYRRGADPISLYASHFLPGLGRVYRRNRPFGVQAGTKTYEQYLFQDDNGTTFHSPILMFAFSLIRFGELTGFLPEFQFPVLDYVVAKTDAPGTRVLEFVQIEGLPTPTTGKAFITSRTSKPGTSSSNGEPMSSGLSLIIGEQTALPNIIKYRASDGNGPGGLAGVGGGGRDPRFFFSLENIRFEEYADYRDNIFVPALDSLIVAIREKIVDCNIILSILIFDFIRTGRIATLSSDKTGKLSASDALNRLKVYSSNPTLFEENVRNLSTKRLADLLEYCLSSYLQDASISVVTSQLSLHVPVAYSGDLSEQGLLTFEADNSREPYRFDVPWLAYEGALFPFSLLATPVAGDSFANATTTVTHRTTARLNAWCRDMVKVSDTPPVIDSLFKSMVG